MPSFNRPVTLVIVSKSTLQAKSLNKYPTRVLSGVKFMIGQIGTAKAATVFLKGLGEDKDIADMVFVTTGKPQPACAALHGYKS